MLKKLGVVTVGITAGLLAAAPLASADEAEAPADSTTATDSILGASPESAPEDGAQADESDAESPAAMSDVLDSGVASAAQDRADDSFAGNQTNVGVLGHRLPVG